MPFNKKHLRQTLEARLDDLAGQTDELRKQVVERAPGVRDQIIERLPDRGQLLDLRDDVLERLPDQVADRLPESVKPKSSRLKRIAVLGALTGAGAAAFAVLRRRGTASKPAEPFPQPASPPPPPPTDTVIDVSEPVNGSQPAGQPDHRH